jgi:hypothetical protein
MALGERAIKAVTLGSSYWNRLQRAEIETVIQMGFHIGLVAFWSQ